MGVVFSYFKLFRFQNLLMIALAQYLVQDTIIRPILIQSHFTPSASFLDFFLLVFSTMLIAAAGYVINDYFDKEIDTINNPEKSTLKISQNTKRNLFYALSIAGVLIGAYLTYFKEMRQIALINFLTVGLLYFYSASYKKMLLVGNIVISFLTALAVFMPVFSDYELYYTLRDLKLKAESDQMYNLKIIIAITFAYAIFAFIISFIREIIKDMEDKEGDEKMSCKTLPVVAGITLSKIVTQFFILVIITLLAIIQWKQNQFENKITFWYTTLLIQLPLFTLFVYLLVAKTKQQFSKASLLSKFVMLTGVLSMLVFYKYS